MNNNKKIIKVEDIDKDTDIHELAMFCKEYTRRLESPQTEAEKLIYRMTHGKLTKDEYLNLEQDVKDFIASDASEEDKRAVGGYTESLSMICNAIREGLL